MTLKLIPKSDSNLTGKLECPIQFFVTLIGKWASELWVEKSDTVRVIGTFN